MIKLVDVPRPNYDKSGKPGPIKMAIDTNSDVTQANQIKARLERRYSAQVRGS